MSSNYVINLTKLKDCKNQLKNEQNDFNDVARNAKVGYLKTSNDVTLQKMLDKLTPLFEKISDGYTNINKWFDNYLKNAEALENWVAESGSVNEISEVEISEIAVKFQKLEEVNINIAGTFGNFNTDANVAFNYADIAVNYNELDINTIDPTALNEKLLGMGAPQEVIDKILSGELSLADYYTEYLLDIGISSTDVEAFVSGEISEQELNTRFFIDQLREMGIPENEIEAFKSGQKGFEEVVNDFFKEGDLTDEQISNLFFGGNQYDPSLAYEDYLRSLGISESRIKDVLNGDISETEAYIEVLKSYGLSNALARGVAYGYIDLNAALNCNDENSRRSILEQIQIKQLTSLIDSKPYQNSVNAFYQELQDLQKKREDSKVAIVLSEFISQAQTIGDINTNTKFYLYTNEKTGSIIVTPILLSSYDFSVNKYVGSFTIEEYCNNNADNSLVEEFKDAFFEEKSTFWGGSKTVVSSNDSEKQKDLNAQLASMSANIADLNNQISEAEENYNTAKETLEQIPLINAEKSKLQGITSLEEYKNYIDNLKIQMEGYETPIDDNYLNREIIYLIDNIFKNDWVNQDSASIYYYIDGDGAHYSLQEPGRFTAYGDVEIMTLEEFLDSHKDNELVQELLKVCQKDDQGKYKWDYSDEQEDFYYALVDSIDQVNLETNNNADIIEKYRLACQEYYSNLATYDEIIADIDSQYENIEEYLLKPDFESNCTISDDWISDVANLITNNLHYQAGKNLEADYSQDSVSIDKESYMKLLMGYLNDSNVLAALNFDPETEEITLSDTYNNAAVIYEGTDFVLTNMIGWKRYMTDEEIAIVTYIYNTEGWEAAYDYLNNISHDLDKRQDSAETEANKEWAKENEAIASVASVFYKPIESGVGFLNTMSARIHGQDIYLSDTHMDSLDWRAGVSEELSGRGSFWYNTGMSAADSLLNIFLSAFTGGGKLGRWAASLSVMGLPIYTSTVHDAKLRGLSDEQAQCLGTAYAFIETLTEKFSVDTLLNTEGWFGNLARKFAEKASNYTDDVVFNQILTYTGCFLINAQGQAFPESGEEISSFGLDFIADQLISGDLSEYNLEVESYINQGYSPEDAVKKAIKNNIAEMFEAWEGGYASGALFGGFKGIATGHTYSNAATTNTNANNMIDYYNQYLSQNSEIPESSYFAVLAAMSNSEKAIDIYNSHHPGNPVDNYFAAMTGISQDLAKMSLLSNLTAMQGSVSPRGSVSPVSSVAQSILSNLGDTIMLKEAQYEGDTVVGVSTQDIVDLIVSEQSFNEYMANLKVDRYTEQAVEMVRDIISEKGIQLTAEEQARLDAICKHNDEVDRIVSLGLDLDDIIMLKEAEHEGDTVMGISTEAILNLVVSEQAFNEYMADLKPDSNTMEAIEIFQKMISEKGIQLTAEEQARLDALIKHGDEVHRIMSLGFSLDDVIILKEAQYEGDTVVGISTEAILNLVVSEQAFNDYLADSKPDSNTMEAIEKARDMISEKGIQLTAEEQARLDALIKHNDEIYNPNINEQTVTPKPNIPSVGKRIAEANQSFGNAAIEIENLGELTAAPYNLKNIKNPTSTYFTYLNENGEPVAVFVPNGSMDISKINDGIENGKYQNVSADNALCYDILTGKFYTMSEMQSIMEQRNETAKATFYEALNRILATSKDPRIIRLAQSLLNNPNLKIVYDVKTTAANGSSNIVYLSMENFNNLFRMSVALHEIGHNIHNEVNGREVPKGYVGALLSVVEHFKNNSASIQTYLAECQAFYKEAFAQAEGQFNEQYAEQIRQEIYSPEHIQDLREYFIKYGLDLNNLDSELERQYNLKKQEITNELADNIIRQNSSKYEGVQAIINDMLFIAADGKLSYINANGEYVELNEGLEYGHGDSYYDRTDLLKQSFDEMMAEFNSGKTYEAAQGTTEFSDTFIAVFGQEMYDFMNSFWADTVEAYCDGTAHDFEALSFDDLMAFSSYIELVGLFNAQNITNMDSISYTAESTNFNANSLISRIVGMAKTKAVTVDVSNLTTEQIDSLIKGLVMKGQNLDNITLIQNGQNLSLQVDSVVLDSSNIASTDGKMNITSLCSNLAKYSQSGSVIVDFSNLTAEEINQYGIELYASSQDINFANVQFLLSDGSYFTFTSLVLDENIISQMSATDIAVKLLDLSKKIAVSVDISNMSIEQINSLKENIDQFAVLLNMENINFRVNIDGKSYVVDYAALEQYASTGSWDSIAKVALDTSNLNNSESESQSITREEFESQPDIMVQPEVGTTKIIPISSLLGMLNSPQDLISHLIDPKDSSLYAEAFRQLKDAVESNGYDILTEAEKAQLDLVCQDISEQTINELSNLSLFSADGTEIVVEDLLEALGDAKDFAQCMKSKDINRMSAFIALNDALKAGGYKLNEIFQARLDAICKNAYNLYDITTIEYSENLPESIKAILNLYNGRSKMNALTASYLVEYYNESLLPRLKQNPNLIYSNEYLTFKKYAQGINSFTVSENMDVPDNFYQNLDNFNKTFAQNEADLYEESLSDEQKTRVEEMLDNLTIYNIDTDIPLLENYFNFIIDSKIASDSSMIYSNEFMALMDIVKNYKGYFNADFVAKVTNTFNQNETIGPNAINMSEEYFNNFLQFADLKNKDTVKFILEYLQAHQNVNIDPENLSKIRLLPFTKISRDLASKINSLIASGIDRALRSSLFNKYGQDQNATIPYVDINMINLDWLTDEQDFLNYLMKERGKSQSEANRILRTLKNLKNSNKDYYTFVLEYICYSNKQTEFKAFDIILKSFAIQGNEFYEKYSHKLQELGMTQSEAIRTLCAINGGGDGTCSFATFANIILTNYIGNEDQFEKDFGYQLPVVNGQKVLDGTELLIDIYIYANSNKNPKAKNNLFYFDEAGKLHIKSLNTENQYCLSYNKEYAIDVANGFLASINPNLQLKMASEYIYNNGNHFKKGNIKSFKDMIIKNLNNGMRIDLGINPGVEEQNGFVMTHHTVKMYDESLTNFEELKGPHSMFVTGITDDYLIVSSWGERYFIPLEDLIDCEFDVRCFELLT